jgi:hypothetical protein
MKDINKMRLGVLRELKNVHRFFDNMERNVRERNPEAVQKAYIFLKHMVYHMDNGCLTPESIALDVDICRGLSEIDDCIA